jgi:hypothetical protein
MRLRERLLLELGGAIEAKGGSIPGGERRRATLGASHLQRNIAMKTATLPSLRVDAVLREAAESVLREGETLSALIETAVREAIHRRQVQAEFLARGLRASEAAKRSGVYHLAADVHLDLRRRLDAKRKQALK